MLLEFSVSQKIKKV